MKIGSTVRHIHKGWIGIVLEISSRTSGVMIDISDESGVMVRIVDYNDLEVLDESR